MSDVYMYLESACTDGSQHCYLENGLSFPKNEQDVPLKHYNIISASK